MNSFLVALVLVFSTFTMPVLAQLDSVTTEVLSEAVVIDEVEIQNYRLSNLSDGTKIQSFDSLSLQQHSYGNLTDLLSNESSLYIKSYGLGSLSSSSMRGGGASQTAVLWNGINMNSSMNGALDFSLIPSLFFDDISIQFGGGSSLWGSGGFGGSIHLGNTTSFSKGTSIEAASTLGSFGLNTHAGKLIISKKKVAFSLALMQSAAENDFLFVNTVGGKDSTFLQQNASFLSTGLMSSITYQTSKKSLLAVNVWYQKTAREIPPTLSQVKSFARQNDAALRVTANWKYYKKRNKFYIKTAYFKEQIYFEDSTTALFANNYADNYVAEVNYTHDFSSLLSLNAGLLNTYIVSETDNYSNRVAENRTAIFSSLKYSSKKKRFRSIFSARQSFINDVILLPTVALQGVHKTAKFLELKGQVSTIYRVPTLNDKFWVPGGNPLLKPERGYSAEFGGVVTVKFNKLIQFSSELTAYSKIVNDWIAWTPSANYWTPKNINKVWSRGMESLSELLYKKKRMIVSLQAMTNYVLSTQEQISGANDNSLGKQLIYVPRYSGFVKVSLKYKDYLLSYRHNYTGYTFTSSDNSTYLSPFDVAAIYASVQKQLKKYQFNFYGGVNNIWNENYQRVLNRPMPLTFWFFGIKLKYHSAK